FNNNNNLNVTLVYELTQNKFKSNNVTGGTLSSLSLGYYGLGLASQYSGGSGYSKHTLVSYVGRVNYTFMNRYILTATYRIDGSSKFAIDNKYSSFPSVAFGWQLLNEPF